MAQTRTLYDAFIDELRDTYDAERQITKALPKMAKTASSPELQAAFQDHLAQTHEHVARLEEAFGLLDEKVRGKRCEGVAGIIDEGKSIMEEPFDEATMDACLIAAAQRVEHYEMAAYGTLVSWADTLGHHDVAALLRQSLDEEKASDALLSKMGEGGINERAAAGGADAGDEDEVETDDEQELAAAAPPKRGARRT